MARKIERSKLITKANDRTSGFDRISSEFEEIPVTNDVRESDSTGNSARNNRSSALENENNNNGFDSSSSGDGSCIQGLLVFCLFLTTTALMVAFPFLMYQSAYVHGWIGNRSNLPYNYTSITATLYHDPLEEELNKTIGPFNPSDLNMTGYEHLNLRNYTEEKLSEASNRILSAHESWYGNFSAPQLSDLYPEEDLIALMVMSRAMRSYLVTHGRVRGDTKLRRLLEQFRLLSDGPLVYPSTTTKSDAAKNDTLPDTDTAGINGGNAVLHRTQNVSETASKAQSEVLLEEENQEIESSRIDDPENADLVFNANFLFFGPQNASQPPTNPSASFSPDATRNENDSSLLLFPMPSMFRRDVLLTSLIKGLLAFQSSPAEVENATNADEDEMIKMDDASKTNIFDILEEENKSLSTSSPIPASPVGPVDDDSRSSGPLTAAADFDNDLKKQQTKGYDNKDENDVMMERKGKKTVSKIEEEHEEHEEEQYADAGRMKRFDSDLLSSDAFVAVVREDGTGSDARTRRRRIKRTLNFEIRDEKAEQKN